MCPYLISGWVCTKQRQITHAENIIGYMEDDGTDWHWTLIKGNTLETWTNTKRMFKCFLRQIEPACTKTNELNKQTKLKEQRHN